MPTKVLQDRASAEEHTVASGDTLESIATAKCKDLGWQVLARYNWGTVVPRELVRAIAETVGAKVTDLESTTYASNPEKLPLEPDQGLAPKLKIPKAWTKDGLALDKTWTVKVRARRAANAIAITELDPWFVPGEEACRIKYRLDGPAVSADKVQLDVFGSNYCECTAWSDGLGTYGSPDALADKPLYTKDLASQAAEGQEYALPAEWKGEVTATEGMLGRKTGTAPARHVNVAFSPYTVHFRYWKAEADKKARLVLGAFWPRWDDVATELTDANVLHGLVFKAKRAEWRNAAKADRGAVVFRDKDGEPVRWMAIPADKLERGSQQLDWDGNYHESALNGKLGKKWVDDDKPYSAAIKTFVRQLVPASLKIAWSVKETTKLERGLLKVIDGRGKVVFQKPLPRSLLTQGDHELAWDGKLAPGIKSSKDGDVAIPDDMPYRVQLQASGTDAEKDESVALAAMHTEVRLYAHPATIAPKDPLYDGWDPKKSLLLSRAEHVPGDPPANTAGVRYYQHKLAEHGFHPGPVNGVAHAEYELALKEFKRSCPKQKLATDYERLPIDAAVSADTTAALEHLEAKYARRPFGDPAVVAALSDAPDLADPTVKTDLPDPSKELIVWVDDRQYYTAGAAKNENNDAFMTGAPDRVAFGLADYRGGMTCADGLAALDALSVPRPWIPLKVELPLLPRDKKLGDAVAEPGETARAAMRRAIGPLRVDWTFDELPLDVTTIDPARYDSQYTRARAYVAWALRSKKAVHTRPGASRQRTYTNAAAGVGGIRDAAATYYREAFGRGADWSLAPWRATEVAATESVATVVHDHLAAAQTAGTDLFEPLIGTAGVYFHPSRIAGDGYRVRAEVQLDAFAGYAFPNVEVLKARYPIRPQAHTAKLRLWRRSSFRGYTVWGAATGHWPNLVQGFRRHYNASHVYFVHECGAATAFAIADCYDPTIVAHQDRYKNTVANNVTDATLQATANMQLRAADLWPWGHRADFGYPYLSNVNVAQNRLYEDFLDDVITTTWRAFRDGLLIGLLRQVEKKGFLRGHLFVEFEAGPNVEVHRYKCNGAPAHRYWKLYLPGQAAANLGNCPAPGCAGALAWENGVVYNGGLPLPAVGCALGATWLFRSSDADTWAHEVGHHRHLEHAASAPGHADALHDSEANSTRDWGTLGVANVLEQRWDRNCVMSYSASNYPTALRGTDHFCGRCLLRNRGWRVTALGSPGTAVGEPTP